MKKQIFIFLSFMVTFFSCNDEVKEEKTDNNQGETEKINNGWKEIISDKGNFKIEFPDYDIEKGYNVQLINNKPDTVFYYKLEDQLINDDNLAYRISYMYFPEIKTDSEIFDHLNYQRDMMLYSIEGVLEVETIIDSLDYPGRDQLVRLDYANMKLHMRMFHYNGITYKLAVMTGYDNLFNKSITKFLNSFKILEYKNLPTQK